ncbi:MAG: TIGR00730 family Rossman fold protein [Actinobacteria bacterium]|nr:TIGR00730 family Rossman fold protein [Actinomycetota bacterium]
MERQITSVCVYCGSSSGSNPAFAEAAEALGRNLAEGGIKIVFGGSRSGLMGLVADAALAAGGTVTGVIPKGLFQGPAIREAAHPALSFLHEVDSMHERKQMMAELSDGFVALPGGLGTLEELAEIATWAQLGIHSKPIVVLDTASYWRPLADFLDQAVENGLLNAESRQLFAFISEVAEVLPTLQTHAVEYEPKWLSIEET